MPLAARFTEPRNTGSDTLTSLVHLRAYVDTCRLMHLDAAHAAQTASRGYSFTMGSYVEAAPELGTRSKHAVDVRSMVGWIAAVA